MSDEKDRFGDRIHEIEKAREDQWARDNDRALMDKIRQRQGALHCPQCSSALTAGAGGELTILVCPDGHGAWVQGEALEKLTASHK